MNGKSEKNSAGGKVVLKLGDDVSTDVIYPGRYMATVLPGETPRYAFADSQEFNHRLRSGLIPPGSIVIAGANFGCGSSREQAASALKGYDLVIVARSFGRIFLQNAVNLGLRILVCPGIEANEGEDLNISGDRIVNRRTQKSYALQPLPAARNAIIAAGGLIPYTRERLLKGSGNAK
jgi:3-isopropylmalate/(R)-2-methylmalate dehydratase small subunit